MKTRLLPWGTIATSRDQVRGYIDPDTPPVDRRVGRMVELIVFATYVAVVVVTAWNHEMWRDEVRALSYALQDGSFLHMLQNLHDGHPAMWYVLLRTGDSLFRTPLVLPVLSGVVAATAVALMLRASPFSPVQKVFLAFGMFLVFEYSVMCRNYGIGVLTLFFIAAAYEWRYRRPAAFGVLLALLANTSVHAAIVALALLAGWFWEAHFAMPPSVEIARRASVRRRVWGGFGIALLGVLACALVASPPPDTILTNVEAASPAMLARAVAISVINPATRFVDLVPIPFVGRFPEWIQAMVPLTTILATFAFFVAVAIGLWGRWSLFIPYALALVGTNTFFRIAYAGALRHVGIVFMLIVILYWRVLADAKSAAGPPPRSRGRIFWFLTVPLTMVLALQALRGNAFVREDLGRNLSSSEEFGAFLRQPRYQSAIVIGEPDYYMDAIPYYAPNRLYFVRRHVFATHATFTTVDAIKLPLGELLASADTLRSVTGQPVLIALAASRAASGSGDGRSASGLVTWTAAERTRFLERTTEVASFLDATRETYRVYELRPPSGGAP